MCESLSKILQLLSEWNWAEIVTGAVSIWVAAVATVALKTWKRQSKAQRQSDFMDEITNYVHEFIASMTAPTEMVKYIRIGIESHTRALNLDPEIENSSAIAYIKRNGEEDSKKLFEYLKLCDPSLTKIRSLVAKGQVLGLTNYVDCQNSERMLTWQYDRVQALCSIIGIPSLNWHNAEVQQTLTKVIQLDSEEIKKDIETYNMQFQRRYADNRT